MNSVWLEVFVHQQDPGLLKPDLKNRIKLLKLFPVSSQFLSWTETTEKN